MVKDTDGKELPDTAHVRLIHCQWDDLLGEKGGRCDAMSTK